MATSAPQLPDHLPSRPSGIVPLIYAITILMTLLCFIAVALRFYARHLKKAALSWDDYMILPATVSLMLCNSPS